MGLLYQSYQLRSALSEIVSLVFVCFVHHSYAGDADFKLAVKGIAVGIEDLQVRQ